MSRGFSVFALQEYPLFPPLFTSWFTHHFHIDRTLAQFLAVSFNAVIATTYQYELVRILNTSRPQAQQLGSLLMFHLCPECITQKRLLERTLVLPGITCCPSHHVILQGTCQCGALLQLFNRKARPFTCGKCGQDWAKLSRNPASSERIALEQEYLVFYEFFFSQGTPELFAGAWLLLLDSWDEKVRSAAIDNQTASMIRSFWKKPTLALSDLVQFLVKRGNSLHDVKIYAELFSQEALWLLKFDSLIDEQEADAISSHL